MTILDFAQRKRSSKSISMLTCYDAYTARILASTNIDCLLVGDSLSMVVYGKQNTFSATTKLMARHTKAVRTGAPQKFIITDMPFLTTRKGIASAVTSAGQLLRAGANAVKIEGFFGNEDIVQQLVVAGIPVMGHVGLTPQSMHRFGGFKKQGGTEDSAKKILTEAEGFQRAGAFAVVVECVPDELAANITHTLAIPTIGIGAGKGLDGQVLVLQDLLGMTFEAPGFARSVINGKELIARAVDEFVLATQQEALG